MEQIKQDLVSQTVTFAKAKHLEQDLAPEDMLRLEYLRSGKMTSDDWYLEPVAEDKYIKEESRFDVLINLLRIKLPSVRPMAIDRGQLPGLSEKLFFEAKEHDLPILLGDVLKRFPEIAPAIDKIYRQYYPLISVFADRIERYREGHTRSLVVAAHITETLLKFEPSLVSLDYLGDFHTYNLNWIIAKLNQSQIIINLEIDTVEYLINRCDKFGGDYVFDKNYQNLSALFLHKARYEY